MGTSNALRRQFNPQQIYSLATQPSATAEPNQGATAIGVTGKGYSQLKSIVETIGTEPQLQERIRDAQLSGASQTFDMAKQALEQIDTIKITPEFATYNRFIVTQKWEGHVVQRKENSITAVISDLTNPSNPPEEIVFDTDEISESDWTLVEPGAVFYWHVGYQDDVNGQRTRSSSFRFRRLPAWSHSEIVRAKREADELFKIISQG